MPRKKHHIHYVYKTTCLITNKYYIGIHSTIKLDDGYIGSGVRLLRSIRKHGKENHIKEILEFFTSREETEKKENILIEKHIGDDKCMNLTKGGLGFKKNHTNMSKDKISKYFFNKNYSELYKDEADREKQKRSDGVKKYWSSLTDEERANRNTKFKCPYCNEINSKRKMRRYHFENCKNKTV